MASKQLHLASPTLGGWLVMMFVVGGILLWYLSTPAGAFLAHGVCYSWNRQLLALHAVSDVVIGLSYFSIPPALWYIVRRREDLPFSWIFVLFGLFIVACGSTHWMEVWTLWHPSYWTAGLIKAFTAAASLPTAVALVFLIPRALQIPSLSAVQSARDQLQVEVAKRQMIEEDLRRAQHELERRVEERTRQLAQSEAHFRTLAETIPHMIWVANAVGELQYVNHRYRAYFGWTGEETVRRQNILAHAHADDLASVNKAWELAISERTEFVCEMRLRRASDLEYRWHLVQSAAVFGEDGNVSEWFGSATDIDEQRRLREQLAEEDRRKDEFLAVLAHELRSPLAPLGNAVQILARGSDPGDPASQVSEVMQRQLRHLVRLVDDLIDVSRIRQGKMVLQTAPLDINRVVKLALDSTRHLTVARSQVVNFQPAEARVVVMGDETRLNQVFQNLINNAAKFTPPQGRIDISVEAQVDSAVVRISDNGRGIAPGDLARIFDLFAQGPSSHAGTGDGLGIGLSLAKQLVEMHGGQISVHSAGAGRGSEFQVRFPVRDLLHPTQPSSRQEAPTQAVRSWRILIVDDNVDSADTLARLLCVRGYQCYTAYCGSDALSIAANILPDVVLLDIGMPEMDGLVVAKRLREELGLWTTLIVAQTGWGQQRDRDATALAGFDHHLVKPIDADEFERLILSGQRSL